MQMIVVILLYWAIDQRVQICTLFYLRGTQLLQIISSVTLTGCFATFRCFSDTISKLVFLLLNKQSRKGINKI